MTEQEYEAALKRVDELMDAEAGTPQAEELSNLADKIVAYEQEHFPIGGDLGDYTCTCVDVYGEDPFCRLHGERRAERGNGNERHSV